MAGTRTELAALKSAVDQATTERLAKWGRDHLATLTPERREQLRKDWEA